jgi:SAM-dependent methyltransferase
MTAFAGSRRAARAPRTTSRTAERLRAHYLVETEIADRLRKARSREERRGIMAGMYQELFRRVPDHPRLLARADAAAKRARDVEWNLAQLRPYLRPDSVFLEIGAGDCALANRLAPLVKRVYAVDIVAPPGAKPLPGNCAFVLTDGCSIDVPEGSVDIAFSDQLMEHLHPEDALEQLANIRRALKPGGTYFCITPNRLYGPTDISGHFDQVARGFHLREYSLREVSAILARAGFGEMHVYVGARGRYLRCPMKTLENMETRLETFPPNVRRRLAATKPMRALLGVRIAAKRT